MSDTTKTIQEECYGICWGAQQRIDELTQYLNESDQRIKRLEEALDLVRPHCSFVHHSKKHQHAYDEPCPVVALIEKAKEAKP